VQEGYSLGKENSDFMSHSDGLCFSGTNWISEEVFIASANSVEPFSRGTILLRADDATGPVSSKVDILRGNAFAFSMK